MLLEGTRWSAHCGWICAEQGFIEVLLCVGDDCVIQGYEISSLLPAALSVLQMFLLMLFPHFPQRGLEIPREAGSIKQG